MISDSDKLRFFLIESLKLARQISKAEHRANPFVNILNGTTKSTDQFQDMFGYRTIFWRIFHSIAGAAMNLLRSIQYAPKRIRLRIPQSNPDVIIISHLVNTKQFDKKTDFYYGDLSNHLKKAGISSHTLFINHCRASINTHIGLDDSEKTILPAYNSPLSELVNIFKMIIAAVTLPFDKKQNLDSRFISHARAAQFGSRALGDFRIGQAIACIIGAVQPRAIIHTFEGQGWERIVSTAAHTLQPRVHVMAYQHAVLFPGERSLNHDHGGDTAPDHIFTTGDTPNGILTNEITFYNDQITTLGSIKHKPAAPNLDFDAKGACLFAPEGTMNEVRLMAKICIQAAMQYPTQSFILRLHPVINPVNVRNMLTHWFPCPPNFLLSKSSLDDDLQKASWLCYRGSTMAFQGILAGLRPIYLDPDKSYVDNNPVPKNVKFQRVARNPDDLICILKQDQSCPDTGRDELQEGRKIAANYFAPFCPNILVDHIKRCLL